MYSVRGAFDTTEASKMDPNMYEAALDLGSNPFAAIFKVVIPFLMPGIVSGFAMAFTLSLDDFIITQFNKGDTGIETLSTYIYEDARVKSLEPFGLRCSVSSLW